MWNATTVVYEDAGCNGREGAIREEGPFFCYGVMRFEVDDFDHRIESQGDVLQRGYNAIYRIQCTYFLFLIVDLPECYLEETNKVSPSTSSRLVDKGIA